MPKPTPSLATVDALRKLEHGFKNAMHSYAAAVKFLDLDKDESAKYLKHAEDDMIELMQGINELVDAKLAERLGPVSE